MDLSSHRPNHPTSTVPTPPTIDPAALEAALALVLPALAERQGAMLAVKDAQSGSYLWANERMAQWLGVSPDELPGRADADLLDAPLVTTLRAAEHTALAQGQPLTSEHRFERDGEKHDYRVLRLLTPPSADGRRLLCSVWTDQAVQKAKDAQLRAALEQLEQLQRNIETLRRELQDHSLRDTRTGLYTRAHFDDQLRREVDLSTREHREFALVAIAVDPPSPRVAELGAPAHTRIVETLGRLLRGNTRAMDASCRVDDRRFAVLLSGVGLATAHARVESLRRECATQIVVLDGEELRFTVSMGVASYPHTAHSQEELREACDAALAEAQRRGGNVVTLAGIRFERVD
ncbi:GGDEF domain-containing protein [Aquincola tertiaricarbonis]|uniref:diguanylate cyclase n=1 Tax=Aquincola tertiaricarbonis TaxID=391953 RepID=A0ABY4SEG6_AQUTE|nr:sensor domain-containing diguanylate cyclase [Aquincola tertiaricarbonis]URI11722.1 GGDEF domain-containing protein [Aquincola tertiaricarbonis]